MKIIINKPYDFPTQKLLKMLKVVSAINLYKIQINIFLYLLKSTRTFNKISTNIHPNVEDNYGSSYYLDVKLYNTILSNN